MFQSDSYTRKLSMAATHKAPLMMDHRPSYDFSIQESESGTPSMKKGHTMIKAHGMGKSSYNGRDLEDAANFERNSKVVAAPQMQLPVRSLPKIALNIDVSGLYPSSSDASTQVYTKGRHGWDIEASNQDQCEFEGCLKTAIGGICDFRICCSRGCQRRLCELHVYKEEDEMEEEDAFKSKVCLECQSRANRAFWLAVLLVFIVPLIAAVPAIFAYGGQ